MSAHIAQQFIDALHALEDHRDVEPLVALTAENGVTGNVVTPDHFPGPEGARKFWTEYRGTFGDAHSEFRNIIATDDRAALEWTTTGSSFEGYPIDYGGVSILEIADGKVTRFCAYFDPKSLGSQIKETRGVS